jgi:hypothetical protein
MKYIAVAAAVFLAAFVVLATIIPGSPDRNVPARTTGVGKTSVTD